MYRQLLCAAVLSCVGWQPVLATGPVDNPPIAENAENTTPRLAGKLVPNRVGDSRSVPYMVVDQQDVVCGEVLPADGFDLRPYCGLPVILEGTATPGSGRLPRFVAQRVVGDDLLSITPVKRGPTSTGESQPVRQAAFQDAHRSVAATETVTETPDNRSTADANRLRETNPLTPTPEVQGYSDSLGGQPEQPCPDGELGAGPCIAPCMRRNSRGVWVQVDSLIWWTSAMHIPPLVTQGTPDQPGRLNADGTEILFGNQSIFGDVRGGGRLQAGVWLDNCRRWGIEGEYLALDDQADNFRIWSDGVPVISRPTTTPGPNGLMVEEVANPGTGIVGAPIAGSVAVNTLTNFQSAGARLRWRRCCEGADCTNFDDRGICGYGRRVDWFIGYRYLRLADRLAVREELTTTDYNSPSPADAGSFLVQDSFQTRNEFHGGELGMAMLSRRGRWSLSIIPKIAFGNTHETVMIDGSTVITDANRNTATYRAGLLALKSNIGTYQNDTFAVVPEIGLNLGYQLTPRLKFLFGYSLVYWSRVARAGNQIDLNVDTDGIPPATGNPTSPKFVLHHEDFWAQGLNFGLECQW
jgi:hypothetical protein